MDYGVAEVMGCFGVVVVGVGEDQVGNILGENSYSAQHLGGGAKVGKLEARHGVTSCVDEDLFRIGFYQVDYQGDRELFCVVTASECHSFVYVCFAVFYGGKLFYLIHGTPYTV